jgi:FkbM family methyltransferase
MSKRDEVRITFDGGLVLHSPTKNASTRLTFIHGLKEPRSFKWMDRFLEPGMNVIDVGGNVGTYALYIAKRVGPSGRVISLEPTSTNLAYLKRNAEANGFSQIILEGVAAGAEPGEVRINLSETNFGAHRVAVDSDDSGAYEMAPMVRLDDLVERHALEHVDFIKIDVEGFEHQVLLGAQETLRTRDPVLLIEHLKSGEDRYQVSRASTAELLGSFGYHPYCLRRQGIEPYDWSTSRGDTLWSR